MDVQAIQNSQYQTAPQLDYNAIAIDINKPQVNVAGPQVNTEVPPISPVYSSIPKASVYEVSVN